MDSSPSGSAARSNQQPVAAAHPPEPIPQWGWSSTSARSADVPTVHREDPVETTNRRQPRRFLDPELAQAIKEAKLKTGASWRRVARFTGLSHSYLVQLSNGDRVPSPNTVEVLGRVLPISEHDLDRLRAASRST